MNLVKKIVQKEFEIALYVTNEGKYIITYQIDGQTRTGEEIDQYEFASILFDMKLTELENATSIYPTLS